jgi:hypothetical protein
MSKVGIRTSGEEKELPRERRVIVGKKLLRHHNASKSFSLSHVTNI